MDQTFARPCFGVGLLPEAGVGGGGAALKDGVPVLGGVGPLGPLHLDGQAGRNRRSVEGRETTKRPAALQPFGSRIQLAWGRFDCDHQEGIFEKKDYKLVYGTVFKMYLSNCTGVNRIDR